MWFRLSLLSFLLASCGPAAKPVPAPMGSRALLEGAAAQQWQQAGIPEEGKITVAGGVLSLPAGQPMTGAKWAGAPADLPGTSYALSYEALREEGSDIFGMATFPVGSHQSHATFVIGGWGGTVTGISSIDFLDANENQTRAEQRFENNRWYKVRIEVRPEDIRAWIDGRIVVNASIKGRKVSLRPGFVDHCVPLGFASYQTSGKVKNVYLEAVQ